MVVIRIGGTGMVPLFINGVACPVPRGIDAKADANQLSALHDADIAFAVIEADFDPQPILKRPVSAIVAMLGDLPADRITALVTAERAGKARATLVAALDARLA